nr:MAG TPA_asm: hypothetical protein [Caudoviricetes sp.]
MTSRTVFSCSNAVLAFAASSAAARAFSNSASTSATRAAAALACFSASLRAVRSESNAFLPASPSSVWFSPESAAPVVFSESLVCSLAVSWLVSCSDISLLPNVRPSRPTLPTTKPA